MEDSFTITADAERRLFKIVMRGLWTVDTVADYHRALDKTVAALLASGVPHREMVALVDARGLTAQTQDAVNSFRERFGDNRLAPRRLATLVSSALFKRQAERIGMGNQRMFTDEAEALAWLLSDTGDCRAPGPPGSVAPPGPGRCFRAGATRM